MRQYLRLFLIVSLCLPSFSFALWQISNPYPAQRRIDPRLGKTDYPLYYYANKPLTIYPKKGLLINNVRKIAHHYGWKVIWKASKNYFVASNTKIEGPTFIIVMNRFLSHYPVNTTYNKKHHILTIR